VERADKVLRRYRPGELEQRSRPRAEIASSICGATLPPVNGRALASARVLEKGSIPNSTGMFISNPDKSVQLTISGQSLKTAWQEINPKLWAVGFAKILGVGLGPPDGTAAVSKEDFEREPYRESIYGAAR